MNRLLTRVDTTAPMWAVSDLDYSRVILGVVSKGLLGSASTSPPGFKATLVFPSAKDAMQAAHVADERTKDQSLAPDLRAAISAAHVQLRGDAIDFQLAAFLSPAAAKAIENLMQQRGKR